MSNTSTERIMSPANLAWNTLLRCCTKTVCPLAVEEIFALSCDTIEDKQTEEIADKPWIPLWKSMYWLHLEDSVPSQTENYPSWRGARSSVLVGFSPLWAITQKETAKRMLTESNEFGRPFPIWGQAKVHTLNCVDMFGFVIPITSRCENLFSPSIGEFRGYSKQLWYEMHSNFSPSTGGHRKPNSSFKAHPPYGSHALITDSPVQSAQTPSSTENSTIWQLSQENSPAAFEKINAVRLFGFSREGAKEAYEALANVYKARPCKPEEFTWPDHPYAVSK